MRRRLVLLILLLLFLPWIGDTARRHPIPEICGDSLDNDYTGTVDDGCPHSADFTASGADYVTEAEDCVILTPAAAIVDATASGGDAVVQPAGTAFAAGYLKCSYNVTNATYYLRIKSKTSSARSTIFVDTAPLGVTPSQEKASLLHNGALQVSYDWDFVNWIGTGTAFIDQVPVTDPKTFALNGVGALYVALTAGVTIDALCLSTTQSAACATGVTIPTAQYVVYELGGNTLTMDGVLETAWNTANLLPMNGYNSGTAAGCCCRLVWDNAATDRLYVGCTITDTMLESVTTTNDAAGTFTDDGIEIGWKDGQDTALDATTFRVVANISSTQAHLDRNYQDGAANNAYTANITKGRAIVGTLNTATDTDGSYTVEMVMDLGFNAAPGDIIRLELRVNDRDNGAHTYRDAFGTAVNGIGNVVNWGYLELSNTALPGAADTTAPTVNTTAESNLAQSSVTLTANTNEAGGCFAEYDINTGTPYASRAPTSGTVASSTGVCTISVTGLTAATGYFWRMCVTDGAGNTDCSTQDTFTTASPAACDHYASPAGTGSACSVGTPCLVSSLWAALAPGETGCLVNGTYTGTSGMLDPPDNFSGTVSQPITIKAQNDGLAIIDAADATGRRPLNLANNNDWLIFDGFDLKRGYDYNAIIQSGSDNNIVRRVVARGVSLAGGEGNFRITGFTTGNLMEDVAGFGRARKCATHAQNTSGTTYGTATYRRLFCVWEDPTNVANSQKIGVEASYNSGHTTYENALMTWRTATSGLSGTDGALWGVRQQSTDSALFPLDVQVLGSIVYLRGGGTFQPPAIATFQQVEQAYDQVLLKDVVFAVEPTFFTAKAALRLFNVTGTQTALQLTNAALVSATANTLQSDWILTNVGQGSTVSAALGAMSGAGTTPWERIGGLCTRYVNRVLTATKLWPWPMNARIITAMTAEGVTTIDVTATMQTLFGTIPAACTD